jgi:hypothetical protein
MRQNDRKKWEGKALSQTKIAGMGECVIVSGFCLPYQDLDKIQNLERPTEHVLEVLYCWSNDLSPHAQPFFTTAGSIVLSVETIKNQGVRLGSTLLLKWVEKDRLGFVEVVRMLQPKRNRSVPLNVGLL